MTTNTPDFIAYGVTQQAGKKDILTRIGGAWKHQKGEGINLQIRALPLNFDGKIVLFPPKSQESREEHADDFEPAPFNARAGRSSLKDGRLHTQFFASGRCRWRVAGLRHTLEWKS